MNLNPLVCLGLLIVFSACEETPTGDSGTYTESTAPTAAPDISRLGDPGGCADLTLTLGSQEGDLVLVFRYDEGISQAAYEAKDGLASIDLDLAEEGSLVLWEGVGVSDLICGDAVTGAEEIHTAWTVISGAAELEVVSLGVHESWDAYPSNSTVVLSGLLLSAEGAEDVTIVSVTWSAATGWLPG